jgi:hypothetical protein
VASAIKDDCHDPLLRGPLANQLTDLTSHVNGGDFSVFDIVI